MARNMRLSKSVCAVVGEVLMGSHRALEELFITAGATGTPPNLAHHSKWKEWLFRSSQDPAVDSLRMLGVILEEFMDLPPKGNSADYDSWKERRDRVVQVLEENGLRYHRMGRVFPLDHAEESSDNVVPDKSRRAIGVPSTVEELLEVIVKGLPNSMHPLIYRRKGAPSLTFESEYDVQDMLHSLLRPWVSDIRPEEFTPSCAGTSSRMDFLLPRYQIVLEIKIIRDRTHAKKVGEELILDIEHYRKHPDCSSLWCVIYDPKNLITNSEGLRDLEGVRTTPKGKLNVRIFPL
jgi:hypothetical protein